MSRDFTAEAMFEQIQSRLRAVNEKARKEEELADRFDMAGPRGAYYQYIEFRDAAFTAPRDATELIPNVLVRETSGRVHLYLLRGDAVVAYMVLGTGFAESETIRELTMRAPFRRTINRIAVALVQRGYYEPDPDSEG